MNSTEQGARDRIRELLAEQAVLRAAEQESQQALTVARARREALATNIGQGMDMACSLCNTLLFYFYFMCDIVKSAVAGLQSDAAVIFLIRHEQMSNRARAFWLASKACFSLRFRVFHELRKWVREQVKVRQFCTSQQQKNCVRVRGLAFAVWKRFIAVLKRGRQLQMWRGRTLRGSLFRRWRAEFVREARQLPAAVATFRSKALSRAFAAFQEASRVRRVAACEGKRLHMYAALFTSVRIFRAWKRLAQSSHREDVRLVGAFRHKAQVRVLRAWAAGATKRRAVLQEYSLIVVSRTTHLFFRRCLHVWRSLYSFRIHLSTTRKLKRSFRRFRSCVVNKRRQRATVLMAGVVAASGEGLLRGALVRCVRLWKARAGRRRRCKSAALRVASFRRAGVLREVWGTWRALSQRFRSLSRHMVLVARRSQWYLQCRAFSQWWSLMPKMPNSEFVSSQTKVQNIRQKWLNLFDDSAPVTAAAAAAGALAGQQHHRPAQLRPNDRQHGQALRVNRFKSSMSTVDFQLLYLDDDDEDEDENNERNGNGDEDREEGGLTGAFHAVVTSPHADAVGASSVFARRYLSRWAQCCARRASLRHRHGRVQVIAAETVCRRTFMVMRAALTARLLSLKDHYRAQLEAPVEMLQLGQSEMLAKRARMEDSEAVEQVKRGDLQQLSDSLSLALTASRVEMEAQQQVLADLDCSVCALGTERSSLLGRIAAAKAYIAGVRQQRDQYLNRGEKDADSRGSFSASDWGGAGGGKALHQAATSFLPGTLPDLLARLSAAATASNNDNDDAVSAGGRFRGGGSLGDGQRDDYSVSLTVQSDSSNAGESAVCCLYICLSHLLNCVFLFLCFLSVWQMSACC